MGEPSPPAARVLLALGVLLGGCTGLQTLPAPRLAACSRVEAPAALWTCLDEVDARLGTGVGRPQPRESAYRSTARVVQGDLRRKFRDQDPEKACGGAPPAGFERLDEPAEDPARAPLHAYFRPPGPGLPTVIVVHGLFDSKSSRYVRVTAAFLAAQGMGVLVPDLRWHGCLLGGWLPTLGLEEGKDLLAWRAWLERRAPASPVGLLGFSLGSLDVISALAADPEGRLFRAGGVVVSPPAALDVTLARLDDPPYLSDYGLQSLFRRFFQDALRHRMAFRHLTPGERPLASFVAWLVRQPPFPAGTTEADFFARADPKAGLGRVRAPLLLLASRRDPLLSEVGLVDLRRAVAANPSLHLIEMTDGGHIGQLGTFPQWTADLLRRFFLAAPAVLPAGSGG